MNTRLLTCTLIATAALAAGCSTVNEAQLVGDRYFKVPIDTYPVHIVAVDGDSVPSWSPVRIEPGSRTIKVQAPPTRAQLGAGDTQEFTLDVQPCTRYHLVAVRENPLLRPFAVRVDHTEPVPGCRAG